MTITPTDDLCLVCSILKHPQVFHLRSLCDGIDPKQYRPPQGLYLLAQDKTGVLGFFYFHAQNPVLWQVHTAFLPHAWGVRAKKAGLLVIEWLAQNTLCRKLVAFIPEFNHPARAYCQRIGGVCEGQIAGGAQKDGELVAEYIYGVPIQ